MIKKILLIFSNPPEFFICYRGSPYVKHLLKAEINNHAEKNATTSKFGQFLPIKNCTFWVKIAPKNAQMKSDLIFVFNSDYLRKKKLYKNI
jgi:hypothetical protein